MTRIALKMLMGDRGKYLSLVFGLSFAVLLITQQGSIFLGLLYRATGFLQNVTQPDLWVADPWVKYVVELRPISDAQLYRVRSVPGVAWAEPFFSAWADVTLPNESFKKVQMIGVDRNTLVGQPPEVVEGKLDDLRIPDAVFIEESGRKKLGDVNIGTTLKINDRRAVVVGFCRAKLGFESNVLCYTTYENAQRFVPGGRKRLSFILVKVKPEFSIGQVAASINQIPGLQARTRTDMQMLTFDFILKETGIGINFGITVLLGFVVGLIVSAATFYQFTLENLRHFAVLKAMGAKSPTLIGMILTQSLVVGFIGYCIGVGLAGLFSLPSRKPGAELTAVFPWQLMALSAVAMLVCVGLGSLLSLRRVLQLEPAVVFK